MNYTEWRYLLAVWEKAQSVYGEDPREWRRDDEGWWIRFYDYGDRDSMFGWEIDHYPIPRALGGSSALENVRPLWWHANARRGAELSRLLAQSPLVRHQSPSLDYS